MSNGGACARCSSQRPSVWRRSLRRCEKATMTSSRRSAGSIAAGAGSGIIRSTDESTRGGGSNACGRDVEQGLDRVAPLQHHRQSPVVLVAGHGRHAVDDFLLQHEVLVLDEVARVEQVEQDRRRDVVGQVADDPEPAARCGVRKRSEVDLEHVGLDHREPGRLAQSRGEVAVQLDHGERACSLQQRRGERAAPRPDLDQRLPGTRIDRSDDPVDHRAVDEEVLSEALPRVRHGGWLRYCGGSRSSM